MEPKKMVLLVNSKSFTFRTVVVWGSHAFVDFEMKIFVYGFFVLRSRFVIRYCITYPLGIWWTNDLYHNNYCVWLCHSQNVQQWMACRCFSPRLLSSLFFSRFLILCLHKQWISYVNGVICWWEFGDLNKKVWCKWNRFKHVVSWKTQLSGG